MAIVPRDDQGMIDFYNNHKTPWNANAAAIGLTAAQITDLTANIAAAEIKLAAAQAARSAVSASYRVAQVRGDEVSEASNPAQVGFQTLAAAA